MNKSELIDALASRLSVGKREAQGTLDEVLDAITRAVVAGEKVAITGFGIFEKVERGARTARNPRTGATVKVRKTSVAKFRPGADLKAFVSGAKKLPRQSAAVTTAKAAAPARSTAKKAPARKAATKAATAKRTAAKRATAKRTTAKRTTAKRTTAKRTTAKRTTAKRTTAKRTTAKRATTKASAARRTTKKAAPRRTTARRAAPAKRTTAKKAPARRTAKRA